MSRDLSGWKEEEGVRSLMRKFCQEITGHYASIWSNQPEVKKFDQGPLSDLPSSFGILEFRPTKTRTMWTYATRCMSQDNPTNPLELHLFSAFQYEPHIELLTIVAHYHCTGRPLGLGHTVNFGRPWMGNSVCEFGLISLPYLDGPSLERGYFTNSKRAVRFLWLLPITKAERDFKKANSIEALEQMFDEAKFDYLDPNRPSVV